MRLVRFPVVLQESMGPSPAHFPLAAQVSKQFGSLNSCTCSKPFPCRQEGLQHTESNLSCSGALPLGSTPSQHPTKPLLRSSLPRELSLQSKGACSSRHLPEPTRNLLSDSSDGPE